MTEQAGARTLDLVALAEELRAAGYEATLNEGDRWRWIEIESPQVSIQDDGLLTLLGGPWIDPADAPLFDAWRAALTAAGLAPAPARAAETVGPKWGDDIRKRRIRCRISLQMAADQFGTTPAHWSDMERGRNQPTPEARGAIEEFIAGWERVEGLMQAAADRTGEREGGAGE